MDLDNLAKVLDVLLAHLKSQGVNSVELSADYYWEIPEERLYDPTNEPAEFTLGQLSHDWERVAAILQGQDEPIGYGLVWVAAILRAIGHTHIH